MPEAHAKLSPSKADTWFNCPGSVALAEGMPVPPPSAYAAEGTQAHTLAEMILRKSPALPIAPAGMLEHVHVYTDAVLALAAEGAKLHVEVQVKATDDVWGTGDAIVWDPSTSTLYVRDLKYGAGVGVEVRGNLQLKIYALAALLTMKYPAKIVNVGIVQPRLPHADGPCRSIDFDAVDLIEFHADLVKAVADVKTASIATAQGRQDPTWIGTYLIPTEKGCRWCLAAPKCPKVFAEAKELASQVFAKDTPYDPAQLASTLDFLPILEGWIKNTREFAYDQAEAGIPIPSYKLVEKTATRKWKPGIADDLAKALGVDKQELFDIAPMKGVTEIQKLAPGKNNEMRAEVLAPFVVKESSGHVLVHESDKREAVRTDAKSVFD